MPLRAVLSTLVRATVRPCVAVAKGVVRLQVSCVLLPTYIVSRLLGLDLFEPKQGTALPGADDAREVAAEKHSAEECEAAGNKLLRTAWVGALCRVVDEERAAHQALLEEERAAHQALLEEEPGCAPGPNGGRREAPRGRER